MTKIVLDCFYRPAEDLAASRQEFALTNTSSRPLKDFTLAYTAVNRATANAKLENAASFSRIANFHEITPNTGETIEPGETWTFAITGLANVARHRLDGPKSAYVSTGGSVIEVVCNDLEAPEELDSGERRSIPAGHLPEPLHIVPWPQKVEVTAFADDKTSFLVAQGSAEEKAAAAKINALAARLFPGAPHPFRFTQSHHQIAIEFRQDDSLAADGYRLEFAQAKAALRYSGSVGRDYGLTVLAQMAYGTYEAPGTFKFPAQGVIVPGAS